MSMKSSFAEQFGQRVQTRDVARVNTGTRGRLNLKAKPGFTATVTLARELIRHGVKASVAKHVAETLFEGRAIQVVVPHYTRSSLKPALDRIGVVMREPRKPDGAVLKAVRDRLNVSQEQFANSLGLEVRTLQNWEQRRTEFDAPTALLVKLLEVAPELAQQVAADDWRPERAA